jgi:hypothetical protein
MPIQFPHVTFLVSNEYLDEEGIWNPRDDEPEHEGAFQVNVFGTREYYLRLAESHSQLCRAEHVRRRRLPRTFRWDHVRHDKTRLHLILRKDDVGDSTWKHRFPKNR